ncbi:unnamed protein product [Hydatigera taeniaeformis]|uniref:VHS domain-containing protein n=1 Tax=Hydatigena taeniaeformis TaxID=6205 RepID=A0A0R3X6E2_HYDTA|nr:unnamed protein product [Hydatigera taeniaeformis]
MLSSTESLENMLTEVTSPLTTHIDLNAFKKIYDKINADPRGPEVALRLLAYKIQSPQEKEALSALVILDLCVQNCGPNFHKELGKFKFLNELMKVLLPKHLGDSTPPVVRDKCIMLMFAWQRDLGDAYPKLREAYQALKAQNIVTKDPVVPNEAECDQKLDRLLKSKNPEDLREANAIIKSIVNEDDARTAKRSRRALQLETLRNNANLLEEMLRCFGFNGGSSASDLDVMEAIFHLFSTLFEQKIISTFEKEREIALNIKQARPVIFELALSDDDREEGFLTDVIETCSRASSVLERYEVVVLHKPPSTVDDPVAQSKSLPHSSAAPESSSPMSENLLLLSTDTHQDLLSEDLLKLGIHHTPSHLPTPQAQSSSDMSLLADLLCDAPKITADPLKPSPFSMSDTTASSPLPKSQLPSTTMHSTDPVLPKLLPNITTTSSKSMPTASVATAFSELDSVGRQMLGIVAVQPAVDSVTVKASRSSKELQPLTMETKITDLPSLSSLPSLTFSAIRPHFQHTQPIQVFPLNNDDKVEEGALKRQHETVEVVLHCTANKPHPSVSVFVVVVTNRSPLPLTNLLLRFGVEKPLKIRQLPLATSSLPAFCSFLPPTPAQQIIYVQQPLTLGATSAKLKFQLSFTLEEEDSLEAGVVVVPLD